LPLHGVTRRWRHSPCAALKMACASGAVEDE
jgi:hypothetical protein